MEMATELERLLPFRIPAVEQKALAFVAAAPDRLIAGAVGRLNFIVTQDADGHIEASVTTPGGLAAEADVHALCKLMGAEPPELVLRIGRGGLFWIVRPGVRQ